MLGCAGILDFICGDKQWETGNQWNNSSVINLLAIGGPSFDEERRESNPQISVRHPADEDSDKGYYIWGYDSKEIANRELKKMNKYDKITNMCLWYMYIFSIKFFSYKLRSLCVIWIINRFSTRRLFVTNLLTSLLESFRTKETPPRRYVYVSRPGVWVTKAVLSHLESQDGRFMHHYINICNKQLN